MAPVVTQVPAEAGRSLGNAVLPDAAAYCAYWGRRYPPSPWLQTRQGLWLHTRLIRPTDAPGLLDLFEKLSPESRRRRFHADVDHLSEEAKQEGAARLAGVDNRTIGGAVLAVDPRDQAIVGVARLARNGTPDDPEAEVAIVVRDDFHGQGVGYGLLLRLGPLAAQMGVRSMLAVIDADNYAAISLFRSLGLPTKSSTSQAETILRITLPP